MLPLFPIAGYFKLWYLVLVWSNSFGLWPSWALFVFRYFLHPTSLTLAYLSFRISEYILLTFSSYNPILTSSRYEPRFLVWHPSESNVQQSYENKIELPLSSDLLLLSCSKYWVLVHSTQSLLSPLEFSYDLQLLFFQPLDSWLEYWSRSSLRFVLF